MTALPLLTYSIAPNTVNVSETDDSSSTCTLQISVVNANPEGVSYTINSITFLIPIGDNAGALIPAGKVEKVNGWTNTSGWTIELSATSNADTSTYASWVLSPQGTAGELTDGSQIVVTLDKVTINTKPGASQIYVYEDIVENPLPDNAYAPLGLIVNKLEPSPALLSFGSNDAAIFIDENVYLNWNSISVSQCVLKCSNPVAELNVPAKSTRYQAPTPTKIGLANYVLFGKANGSILSQTLHTSVTVLSAPTITSFTAKPGTDTGTLNVSWNTRYTTEVTLTLTGTGATPPVATFGGLPANGLNALLSDLSPNWAGTLTLTAIDPDSTKIATQTLKIPANACTLSISVVNYDPSQFWSFYSYNLCPSPDGKNIIGLMCNSENKNGAVAVSADDGKTWSITNTKEQIQNLPNIISSNSSSYFGIFSPLQGKNGFKFYTSTNTTGWNEKSEYEFSCYQEIKNNSIFEFQEKIWIYTKIPDENTVEIYKIDSSNSFEHISSVTLSSPLVGLSPYGEKLVLITYNSIMTSSDGKTWNNVYEHIPWLANRETPITPPISHNGCMWVLASKLNNASPPERYISMYCQDKTGKWMSCRIPSNDWKPIEENLFTISNHSVFIANGLLQVQSTKRNDHYTYLRIHLPSTPSLTLPHSE